MSGQNQLKKALGMRDVYVLALGPMLSSGFFLLPGLAAAVAGPAVIIAYLLGSMLMVPAMLSQAELASAMPRAGGTFYFLDRSLGPIVGSVGGLGTWLVLVLKAVFALIGLGAYLALLVHVPYRPVAIALTLALGVVAYLGTDVSGRVQRFLVVGVLGFLAVFLLAGMLFVIRVEPRDVLESRMVPFFPTGLEGLAATAGLVFISFAGLTKVASLSEEVKDPERSIPLGMMFALLTIAVVYVVGVFVMVAALDPALLHGDLTPVASAGLAIFAGVPRWVVLPVLSLVALAAIAEHVDSDQFWLDWMKAGEENELREVVLRDERFMTLRIRPEGASAVLAGRSLREVDLPPGARVALIRRSSRIVVPRGDTTLTTGDRLSIVGEPEDIRELRSRYW